MGKVPGQAKGAGQKQIRPADYGDADTLVGTIAAVNFREGQFGMKTHLGFEEYEGVELRQGKRGTDRLIEKFGDETNDWIGERVPLVRSREQVGKETYVVYQVAPVEEWDRLLKAHKSATKGRK